MKRMLMTALAAFLTIGVGSGAMAAEIPATQKAAKSAQTNPARGQEVRGE